MCVHGPLQVLGARRVLHRQHRFGNQLAGHRTDDVHAEDLVVVGRRDDLAEAGSRFHGAGAATRQERERAGLVRPPALLDLFLGEPDPGDLRRGIDHRRNRLVVHFRNLAGDQLGDHHAFFLALVREHRAAHEIADRPDVRGSRTALVIDSDEATLVDLYTRALAEQILRERPAADRHHDLVDFDALLALRVGVFQLHTGGALVRARHLCAETNVEPELLEVLERFLRYGAIGRRQERIERFEHDHFCTETSPDAAELEADDAGADHAEALRHGVELQRAPRIDDLLAVKRQTLQFDGRGACSEHDVLRGQLFLLAILVRELDAVAAQELAVTLQAGDTGALEEPGNAESRLPDDLRAALLHGREIELDAADLHAVHGELVLGAMEQLGRFEHRLGWNAARVETGAAEGVGTVLVLPLVDAGDLELVLAGADGAGITGGTAADHDHIVLGHTTFLLTVGGAAAPGLPALP